MCNTWGISQQCATAKHRTLGENRKKKKGKKKTSACVDPPPDAQPQCDGPISRPETTHEPEPPVLGEVSTSSPTTSSTHDQQMDASGGGEPTAMAHSGDTQKPLHTDVSVDQSHANQTTQPVLPPMSPPNVEGDGVHSTSASSSTTTTSMPPVMSQHAPTHMSTGRRIVYL